jgi:hypothetical protein
MPPSAGSVNAAQKVCTIMSGLKDKELEEAKIAFIESLDRTSSNITKVQEESNEDFMLEG